MLWGKHKLFELALVFGGQPVGNASGLEGGWDVGSLDELVQGPRLRLGFLEERCSLFGGDGLEGVSRSLGELVLIGWFHRCWFIRRKQREMCL